MTTARTATNETEIRKLIENWVKAVRAKDIDAVMSFFAPDILLFDLAPPLEYRGADVYRKGLLEWFATFQGPVGYELRGLSVATDNDLAFSRAFGHIQGKRTNGEETDVWVRSTVCYRKINGMWKILHEHVSVPFYMDGSIRAAVDLKP